MNKLCSGRILLVVFALMAFAGCGPKGATKTVTKNDRPAYVSKGDEGTITGKVVFEGAPPELPPISTISDAACAATGDLKPDVIIVNNGRLKSVFVYIKGPGVDNFQFPVGEPVTLDQRNCRYVPHVLGAQAGQIVRITNSDETSHNVHPTPKRNEGFNISQVQGDAPIEHIFASEEVMIPVQCNQHNWMKAHIGVLNHPFFAISADDGSFTIKNVPPGDYTLVFWHEFYGEQSQPIKVTTKGTVTQDATYKAGDTMKPAIFLRMEPILIVP